MASKISIRVGMPEFIFVAGVYMHTQSKYLSIGMMIFGVLNAFGRYCMERSDNEQAQKDSKKILKEVCDSVTAMSFANMTSPSKKLN